MPEEVQAKSFGDFISDVNEGNESTASAAAPVQTDPATDLAQDSPAAAVEPSPQAVPVEPVPKEAAPQVPQGYVPLAALQEARNRTRALQEKLSQYETPSEPEPSAAIQAPSDPRWTAFTETQARRELPDFDEKLNAFSSEVYDPATGQVKNEALYHSVMNSLNPALAAYEAGQSFMLFKKHGTTNFGKIIEAERAAALRDHEPKLREKFQAEIDGKLKQRSQTPTNISEARSAGGDASVPWKAPSFADELRNIKKGR